jgi:hypothetical protein
MDSEVALAERAEDGVGQRMSQGICVRMAHGPARRINLHAAQDEGPPVNQPVRVVAYADAKHRIKSQESEVWGRESKTTALSLLTPDS